ncbi:class I SAM-dependent methyltransferase [Streptomyces sp. MZ04]|uniref:class I SAM-dependent methyltransferase n=1 Tax=Streptomyces sp. MZ04 TaxID=2559236 RepID=UPI001FD840F3|nr:class I SAM-dependent methyltransferase [Streptomyces sp. MZ04]
MPDVAIQEYDEGALYAELLAGVRGQVLEIGAGTGVSFVRAGRVEQLPVPTGSFDVVVISRVLCSVKDVSGALAELRRVLRPGGELRFYEHIRSGRPGLARTQRALDLIWPLVTGGCHLARRTEAALAAHGLRITDARHFDLLVAGRVTPASPCVIGRAVRHG